MSAATFIYFSWVRQFLVCELIIQTCIHQTGDLNISR
jgi:hypothetical protein